MSRRHNNKLRAAEKTDRSENSHRQTESPQTVDPATLDLRIAQLVMTYGPEAITIAREQVHHHRAANNWPAEQQWLTLLSSLLQLNETGLHQPVGYGTA